MLHIVKSQQAIHELLSSIELGDTVLLIEDSVYLTNPNHHLYSLLTSLSDVTALRPDVHARGLANLISQSIAQVNYAEFVELTVRHHSSLTWE
ncbi:sulfurtransferase complex subunit TusB [Vibrio sp. RC27]